MLHADFDAMASNGRKIERFYVSLLIQKSSEGEGNRDEECNLSALGRELASYRKRIAENLGRKLVVYSEASGQLVESAKRRGIYPFAPSLMICLRSGITYR